MINEKRVGILPIVGLISINIIYLTLIILDEIEGVFAFWIFFVFLSLLPLIIKNRKNIIYIIVVFLPFEITKLLIPFFQTVETKSGAFNSVFDLARLFILFSILVWFISDLKSFVPVIKHKISFILLLYISVYLLSTILISPDMSKGLTEVARYLIYFLFFTMVTLFIKNNDDIISIFRVLVITATILSVEGIFEFVFDYYLWVDQNRRATATFFDPNIFARFLVIAILILFISRVNKIYIFKPQFMDISLLICSIALLLTVSRQGWLIFIVTIFFVSFYLDKKTRILIILALVAIILVSTPILLNILAERDNTLTLFDIGERAGLLLGGIFMFLSSPIYGIGAGGFQSVMIDKYLDLLPWGILGSTLPHTYIVTILAEIGIIGFIIFMAFIFIVYRQFVINYKSRNKVTKALALMTFSSMIVIFIGSQAEGRFFEEPYLWLMLGIHVVIGNLLKSEQLNPES